MIMDFCEHGEESIMERGSESKTGTQLLLEMYMNVYGTSENMKHYSEQDYQAAKRKFLKEAPEHGSIELKARLFTRF